MEIKPQFLKLNELLVIIPISKASVYVEMKKGSFPLPIKFGRASLWAVDEVQNWMLKKRRERDNGFL